MREGTKRLLSRSGLALPSFSQDQRRVNPNVQPSQAPLTMAKANHCKGFLLDDPIVVPHIFLEIVRNGATSKVKFPGGISRTHIDQGPPRVQEALPLSRCPSLDRLRFLPTCSSLPWAYFAKGSGATHSPNSDSAAIDFQPHELQESPGMPGEGGGGGLPLSCFGRFLGASFWTVPVPRLSGCEFHNQGPCKHHLGIYVHHHAGGSI